MSNRKRHVIVDIRNSDDFIACHDGWTGKISEWDAHKKTPEIAIYEPDNVWARITGPKAKKKIGGGFEFVDNSEIKEYADLIG